MSTTARIEMIHCLFLIFVALTLLALFGIAVTGNAWFWVAIFGCAYLAYRQVEKLPFDHSLRIYLRGRVDAWF